MTDVKYLYNNPIVDISARESIESLDTRVRFSGNEDKGKIIIDYYSKEQLQELFDKLS